MRLSIIILVVVLAVTSALPVEEAETSQGNSNPENIESAKEAASTPNAKSQKEESRSIGAANAGVGHSHQESHTDADGGYEFSFETENGQKRDENGHIDHTGVTDNENIVVKGHFSYVAPDGIEFIVKYIADEKGFRPIVNVKRPAA